MTLTIAVCTWNRSRLLRATLESFTRLAVPAGVEWEVLVVDNNCKDDTAAVVRSFTSRLPVRLLFEPSAGKSSALNHAVREAAGEYILFTDDDVIVDPGWLGAYCAAFRNWPEAVVFGGAIEPLFEGEPPAWLSAVLPRIGGVLAVCHPDSRPIRAEDSPLPFGANMAIRSEVQRAHPYDTKLGPRAERHGGGEETAIVRAILREGLQGRWIPEARVHHRIPAARQTRRYIRKYFFDSAATIPPQPGGRGVLRGRPGWVWRQAIAHELLYWPRRIYAPPDRWIADLQLAASAWGILMGRRQQDDRTGAECALSGGDP